MDKCSDVLVQLVLPVIPKIKEGALSEVNHARWDLYGMAFLIDENLKPWLLEGNRSPRLTKEDEPMINALMLLTLSPGPEEQEDNDMWCSRMFRNNIHSSLTE